MIIVDIITDIHYFIYLLHLCETPVYNAEIRYLTIYPHEASLIYEKHLDMA